MTNEILLGLYKTKEGRKSIVYEILKDDNLSISEIVQIKESAMNDKNKELNNLVSGMGIRMTTMFMGKKQIEQVKPLVAKDILESGVVLGTPFEKELLEKYPHCAGTPEYMRNMQSGEKPL